LPINADVAIGAGIATGAAAGVTGLDIHTQAIAIDGATAAVERALALSAELSLSAGVSTRAAMIGVVGQVNA
jgi:hypothetical protein